MRIGSTQRTWTAAIIVAFMMMLHTTHVHAAGGEGNKPPAAATEAKAEQADDDDQDDEFEDDDDDDWDDEDDDTPMANFLGRNLRLVFELRPLEANDKSWSIITATPEYSLKVNLRHGETEFHINITGTLTSVWGDDEEDDDDDDEHDLPGQYLVAYHSDLAFTGEGNTVDVSATGSRLMYMDEAKLLAELGDKSLYLKLVDADDE